MSTNYITTPIYYANAKPHIGHAYTTLAADVVARYLRMRGSDVFFQTGTDEHGAKIAEAAAKEGIPPEEFVKRNAAKFQLAWDALDISSETFWRTHTSEHMDSARVFFERLHEVGALYEGDYEGLYCVGCESFKTEKELTSDGLCPDHQRAPKRIRERNWFFRLTPELKSEVRALIERDRLRIVPDQAKREVLGLFEQEGFGDFSVSREKVEWGISMPDFAKGHTMYVWVEALHNYLAAVGHGRDSAMFARWWPPTVQFVGRDIIKFHGVWFPAMLLALQRAYPEYALPETIITNGYFTVNGQKMSKSIGNVIDPLDLVERYGSDAARWLILSQFPYGQDGDLQEHRFDEQYTADLVHGVGNVLSRVLGMLEKYNASKIPSMSGPERPCVREIGVLLPQTELSLFDVLSVPDRIRKSVHALDEDIAALEPWKRMSAGASHELDAAFVSWLECLRIIALAVTPVMPNAGRAMGAQLGCVDTLFEALSLGAPLGTRSPLFPKLPV